MNRARLIVTAALLTACIPGLSAQSAQGKSTIVEKIIVKVNGEILTQSELEKMQIEVLQQDQNRRVASPRDLTTDAALITALAEVTPRLLVDAVDDLLLVQHGKELGVKFTDENFKLAIENVKKQNKLTDEQFPEALKQAGMTLDQLRQNFERTWIIQQVEQREIMKNMTLTEEEARQYYKAHPDQFMKAPTVTVREILVAVPVETVGGAQTVNVGKDDEAKAKAASLRERALKGEDFAKLVAEASDAGTKANGGLIGPVLVEELNPAISSVLEKLKQGEVSDVIRTARGYQIFKLESRTSPELEAFDKVRGQIAQHIGEARLEVEKAKFLEKLRAAALIEWKDDMYKKMFEQGQAQRAKTG